MTAYVNKRGDSYIVTTVRLREELYEASKTLKINRSAICEIAIAEEIKRRLAKQAI